MVGGRLWEVLTVDPTDPRLVDRTGAQRLATADPATRTICVSARVRPPLLDRVLVHEMWHAVTEERGLLGGLRSGVDPSRWVHAEEWAASAVELHALEAVALASRSLGRPVCVDGLCFEG